MNKVVIINPPLVNPKYIDIKKKYHTIIPLGLLYIAEAVDRVIGWHSDIYDLNLMSIKNAHNCKKQDLKSLVDMIPDSYAYYMIGCMFSSSENIYYEVCRLLKERDKVVVVGGVQATAMEDFYYDNDLADIVVINEGEDKISNLLRYGKIKSDGVVVNPPSIVNQFRKINFDDYNKYGDFGHSLRVLAKDRKISNLQHNRGCRGNCCFCSVRMMMGDGVRSIDIEKTLDELDYLYLEKGIRHIDWLDDDLLANKEITIELFHRIADRNYDLTFSINNASLAINIDEEVVDAVVKAGFIHMAFGIETPDKSLRRKMRKAGSLKNIRFAVDLFRERLPDIFLHGNYMIGFPDETVGQIKHTIDFANSLDTDWSQFAIVQTLPKTDLYEKFKNDDEKVNRYSPASEQVDKNKDKYDFKLIDLFLLDDDYVPMNKEVTGFWHLINYKVNLLDRKNISWKTNDFVKALLEVYNEDIVLQRFIGKRNGDVSPFWSELLSMLKKHDVMNRLGLEKL